ncbi:fungal-specific transcription factor domain-containing protein [Cunninghamella echinulata]|nr:fungal-specific transcription factor domain-containing protein [Cunninghamella echinulata]
MTSIFTNENENSMRPERPNDNTRTKRPRSSLACIRCRKKKVKCDFVQPTCDRCVRAGLPCSYATPPRRVDGQAFDKLGSHVEDLRERMHKIQTDLVMMKSNLHTFSSDMVSDTPSIPKSINPYGDARPSSSTDPLASSFHHHNQSLSSSAMMFESQQPQQQIVSASTNQQPVTWKLSLSPNGLRIDTNIASVADLYRILLNGISQLNINGDSATSLFSMDAIRSGNSKRNQDRENNRHGSTSSTSSASSATASQNTNQAWGRFARQRSIENINQNNNNMDVSGFNNNNNNVNITGNNPSPTNNNNSNNGSSNSRRLWEVNETEARMIMQENQPDDTMDQETLNQLVNKTYHPCFLSYQIVNWESFVQLYNNTQSGLDPLLVNSINAWISKHACIYHGVGTEKDPSTMGDTYFSNARQHLKKCFDISSPNTIHALINLYMYQRSCERSKVGYLYIGLAIRMAQDLKLHKREFMPADPVLKEANKRLWWSAYWLDLCAALELNRPTMVDDKDCDLDYPTKLDSEDEETGHRIAFTVHSIKLMKVRKDITKHLPSEQSGQSLLSAISRLENALTNWLQELPQNLRFENDETFKPTNSFRDEACMILNIQYQTTWIMLHKFFLPKRNQTATPVALLSLNICTKSANLITKMLDIYQKHLPWCQFFYALDGVLASITIHQVNALSTEDEVAHLAQRNLIVTADILRQSPLMYMDKVNGIVESIDDFLKNNGLPTELKDLPDVSEDSINQQCISSVFHPSMFESNPSSDQQQQNININSNNNNNNQTPQSSLLGTPNQQSQSTFGTSPLNNSLSSNLPTPNNHISTPSSSTSQSIHQNQTLHQQGQQYHSPISLAGSPMSSGAHFQPVPSNSANLNPSLNISPSVMQQQQQHHSQTGPIPINNNNSNNNNNNNNNNNHLMFNGSMINNPTLLSFSPQQQQQQQQQHHSPMNNMNGNQPNIDQFIFNGDMSFMNASGSGQNNMFGQLGTPVVNSQDMNNSNNMNNTNVNNNNNNNNIHHGQQNNTMLSNMNNPDQQSLFNMAGPSQNLPYIPSSQANMESLTQPSTSTDFSNMDVGALHDILYGTPSVFNTMYGNATGSNQQQQSQQIANPTALMMNQGYMNPDGMSSDNINQFFPPTSGAMNLGQKRAHREWDDSH